MSSRTSPEDPFDFCSVAGDAGGEFEDSFTAVRPPEYNNSDQPSRRSLPTGPSAAPQTGVTTSQAPGHILSSQLDDAGQHYPASNSAATVTGAEVAAATQATLPRLHILFHTNRDYNSALQPLTERAVAALNHDVAHGSGNGNVGEWIHGRSQFSPTDPMGINMSVLRNPPTGSATRTDSRSSWSMISSSTLQPSQIENVADAVCATGQQFADVSAPIGPLLDEDCVRSAMPHAPRQPPDGDD
ncbi:hypothetical protein F4824DRAFT_494937 [Ustulina deusta]|nr:hypothetical protein F4824DRAFT_494937 [Ustulina deusta]